MGLANALSVADTAPVDLSTVGPSFNFSSPAAITPYGSAIATASATVASDVCLSSTGAWFTATVSAPGADPVQLVGSLQTVIGSGDDVGYVFRGTLTPSSSVTGPLAGAVQFVAEVGVVEPDNTAQLTVVFLGTEPETGIPNVPAGSGPIAGGVSTTPPSGSGSANPGAGATPSTPSAPVVSPLAPTLFPNGGFSAAQGAAGGSGTDQGSATPAGSGTTAIPLP